MRSGSVMLALVLASLPAVAAAQTSLPAAPTAPAPAADLAPVLEALRTDAQAWAQRETIEPPAVAAAVAALEPSQATLLALRRELAHAQSRDAAEDLYIRGQLLTPLNRASPEALRPLLPILASVGGAARFDESLPRYGDAELERLGASGEQAARARERKLELDRQVLRRNLLARQMRRTLLELQLRADLPTADRSVLAAIRRDADDGLVTYLDALAAIEARSTDMPARRAKVFYDELRGLAGAAGGRQAEFVDPTDADLVGDRNAQFRRETRVPGQDVAELVNLLATAAREPAIEVPQAREGGERRGGDRPGREGGERPARDRD